MKYPWLITGATGGVGRSLVDFLAAQGHNLLLTSRSDVELNRLVSTLKTKYPTGNFISYAADSARLEDVHKLANWVGEQTGALAGLVHAGGRIGWTLGLSSDGFDKTLQVNYLSAFLLDLELQPLLAAGSARVLLVAGAGFTLNRNLYSLDDYQSDRVLPSLKGSVSAAIAKVYHAYELNRRWKNSGITSFAFHPGFLKTRMLREASWWIRWPGQMANLVLGRRSATGEFLALDPSATQLSGTLVEGRHSSSFKADPEAALALWNASITAVKIQPSVLTF